MPAPPIVFPEYERRPFSVNQGIGQDTDEVLRDVGYSNAEIAELKAKHIAR